MFPLGGNFDIGAGDGDGGGDHLGPPKIPKHLKQIVRTEIIHTSGTFSKSVKIYLRYVHI